MTNDVMLGGVYILMAMMLVLGALMSRREPVAKLLTMALAWVAIFGAGFVLFTFRDNFGWVAQRLEGRGDRHAGRAGPRNAHPDGHRRPFLGRGQRQWRSRSSSSSTAARR